MKGRVLLLLAAAAPLGCSGSGQERSGARPWRLWSAAREGPAPVVETGSLRPLRSSRLSPWFGRSEAAGPDEAPRILGDTRDAVATPAPTRFRVEVPAAAGLLRLRGAVRRPAGAFPPHPLRAEVFLRRPGEERPRSLAARILPDPREQPAAADWQALAADFEAPAGAVLEFVARNEGPGLADLPGAEVHWAELEIRRSAPGPRPPDVLLVTVDTLRADHLDLEGASLRELFLGGSGDGGAWWPRALSPSIWTLPSYASLFTARDDHGAGRGPFPAGGPDGAPDPRDYRILDPLPTLAEAFQEAGYATAMLHQNPLLEPWTGLDRGFGRYARLRDRPAEAVAEARSWWEEHEGSPRFLVLHLMAPHLPYDPELPGAGDAALPPDPLEGRDWAGFLSADHGPEERRRFFDLPEEEREALRRRYAAEVRSVHRALEPWIRELRDRSDLLLALHSDHGEEHWEHGGFEHGHAFVPEVAEVGLLLRGPGVRPGVYRDGPWRVRDLGPTLLRLAGLPLPPGFEGDLFHPAPEARCLQPLYRAEHGGLVRRPGGDAFLPFDPQEGAGGRPAQTPDPDLAAALAELGYAGGY